MASLWKHPESKYWVACFTDHQGRRRKKSTKTTKRSEAMKIAETLEQGYRKQKTEAQVRSMVNELFKEIHESEFQSSPVETFVENYLKEKEYELSPASFRRYKGVIKDFKESLDDEKRTGPMVAITLKDIDAFKIGMLESKLSPSTVNTALKILRNFFKTAHKKGEITENPIIQIDNIKTRIGEVTRRPFTLAELKKVYNAANHEWRGMILFGFYTGQRLGDVAKIQWEHINLEHQQVVFVTQKTGKKLFLPLANPVIEYLKDAGAEDPKSPIFPNAFEIVVSKQRSADLSNQFMEILISVGLAPKRTHKTTNNKNGRRGPRKLNELSFHCLRHTTTSLLKQSGASQAIAMGIIGHDSEAVSDQYTHVGVEVMDQYISKLPMID